MAADVIVTFEAQDTGLTKKLDELKASLGELRASATATRTAIDGQGQQLQKLASTAREATAATGGAAEQTEKLKNAHHAAGEAGAKHSAAMSDLRERLREAASEVPILGRHLGKFVEEANGMTFALGGALAALGAFVVKGGEWAEQLNEVGDRTGLAAGQVAVLQRAAVAAGISGDGLTVAVETMNRVIGQGLTDASGIASKHLANLGIHLEELKDQTVYQRLQTVAEAISGIEDPSQRAAAAAEVFGKSSGKLLELIKDFPEAVRGATDSMATAPAVIDRAAASVQELGKKTGGVWQEFKAQAVTAAGSFSYVANRFADGYSSVDAWLRRVTEGEARDTEVVDAQTAAVLAQVEARRQQSAQLADLAARMKAAQSEGQAEGLKTGQAAEIEGWKELTAQAEKYRKEMQSLADTLQKEATARKSPTEQESIRYQEELAGLAKKRQVVGETGEVLALEEAITRGHSERMNAINAEALTKGNTQAEAAAASRMAGIQHLRETLQQERESRQGAAAVEIADHDKRVQEVKAWVQDNAQMAGQGNALIEQIEIQHAAKMRAIRDQEATSQVTYMQQLANQGRGIQDGINVDAAAGTPGGDPEMVREQQRYDARLTAIQDYEKKAGGVSAASRKWQEDEESIHQQRTASLEAAYGQKRLGVLSTVLGNMSSLMNTRNRQMFEIGKAAAISGAIVDTYRGANQAFADPTLLSWEKFAVAASIVTSGLVNVANIAGTSFGDSGGGGGAAGAAPAGGGGAGGFAGGGGGSNSGSPGGPRNTTINISGTNFSRDQVIQLAKDMSVLNSDGGGDVIIRG